MENDRIASVEEERHSTPSNAAGVAGSSRLDSAAALATRAALAVHAEASPGISGEATVGTTEADPAAGPGGSASPVGTGRTNATDTPAAPMTTSVRAVRRRLGRGRRRARIDLILRSSCEGCTTGSASAPRPRGRPVARNRRCRAYSEGCVPRLSTSSSQAFSLASAARCEAIHTRGWNQ